MLSKLFGFLAGLIPSEYKWGVATKNVAYDIGKAAAGLLTMAKATAIFNALHITITPDMQAQAATIAGALATGVLAWLHDYLQVKFPNNPFL